MMETSITSKPAETIYYTQISTETTLHTINNVKQYFSEEIISRIEKGTNLRLKARQYISKAILIEICKRKNIDPLVLRNIYYAKNGKMLFKNNTYYVSMSYSKNIVACYLGLNKKGLDIEFIERDLDIDKVKILSQLTEEKINNNLKFYKIWTTIESLIKYHDNMDMYQVLKNKIWKSTHININNYITNNILFSVASENIEKLKIKKL